MRESSEGTLFLHYPCFDGLVSASIAWDVLEGTTGWMLQEVRPVNYDRARTWIEAPLPKHSAVVDFLYHPDAEFWADHHGTTFSSEADRLDYERNALGRTLLYDSTSPSCAMLLWKSLKGGSSDPLRYEDMAAWGNRIDGAQYASVDEAVFGTAPAITINLSLIDGTGAAYGERLLRAMRTMSSDAVAALDDVRARADLVRTRTKAGLQLVRNSVKLQPGAIAVFQAQPDESAIVNRYSAYCFFPEARYSVALIRSATDAKITAMRNPWLDFESVQLGTIFQKYGGGGHQRVASVVLRQDYSSNPADVLTRIVEDIRIQDQTGARTQERIIA